MNIINYEHNKLNDKIMKIKFINSILNELGFENIYDNKYIKDATFDDKIKKILETNEFLQNLKNLKVLFNLAKLKKKEDLITRKAFLEFINSILINYSIKLLSIRKKVKQIMHHCYYIEKINNINEIIDYKIQNSNYKLIDANKIFQYNKIISYNDLEQKMTPININYSDIFIDLI